MIPERIPASELVRMRRRRPRSWRPLLEPLVILAVGFGLTYGGGLLYLARS